MADEQAVTGPQDDCSVPAGKLAELLPPTVEKGWNFNDHPLISAMQEQEGKAWSLFSGATCWLPVEG